MFAVMLGVAMWRGAGCIGLVVAIACCQIPAVYAQPQFTGHSAPMPGGTNPAVMLSQPGPDSSYQPEYLNEYGSLTRQMPQIYLDSTLTQPLLSFINPLSDKEILVTQSPEGGWAGPEIVLGAQFRASGLAAHTNQRDKFPYQG